MWQRGRLRHPDMECQKFIRGLLTEWSAKELARRCGVSDRTIRRWRDGVDVPSRESLERLIDSLYPINEGSLPIYSPAMAIDGDTRVGGVGDFSRGLSCTE